MAPKKRKTSTIDYMGCENLSSGHKKVWRLLFDRGIMSTKFVAVGTLAGLGLASGVEELFGRLGLGGFYNLQAPTFRRYTLEFLSTLEVHRDVEDPHITFHLEGEERELSFTQLREIFGIDESGHEGFEKLSDHKGDEFWKAIRGEAYRLKGEKNADIPHPGLRYVHRVLTSTFLCKGEPTHLPKSDLSYLWAMMPECQGHPDWLDIFLSGCEKHQGAVSGNIPMGGMVTLIARYLEIEDPKDPKERIPGETSINMSLMKGCEMVVYVASRAGFVWTLGTDHQYYLRLPRSDEFPLPLGPTPRHFLLDSDVDTTNGESRRPRVTPLVSPVLDNVAAGPLPPSDFEKWSAWREEVEDMLGESLDNSRLCAETSRSVNRFYLTKYPGEYVEPSKEFYDELDANKKARLARKEAREARSRGAPSSSRS